MEKHAQTLADFKELELKRNPIRPERVSTDSRGDEESGRRRISHAGTVTTLLIRVRAREMKKGGKKPLNTGPK